MAYFPPDANEQHNHEPESYGDLQKDQEMDVEPSAAMKIEKKRGRKPKNLDGPWI